MLPADRETHFAWRAERLAQTVLSTDGRLLFDDADEDQWLPTTATCSSALADGPSLAALMISVAGIERLKQPLVDCEIYILRRS